MKGLVLACVCGLVSVSLAGCGSSAPPPLALACTTRTLHSGLIQARVTVSNTTQRALRGIVYGPALRNVRFIHPVFRPLNVTVQAGKQQRAYVGFVIPAVRTKSPTRLLFHLVRPRRPQPILAALHATVRISSWADLQNGDCTIK